MADKKLHIKKTIVFKLSEEEYIIPVKQVRSIEKIDSVDHITRVPGTVDFLKGVINLRGMIIPLIDLRTRFGLRETYSDQTRFIIVSVEELEIGLIVDAATDVIDIPIDEFESPISLVQDSESEYIESVVKLDKRLLILIDFKKITSADFLIERVVR